MPQQPQFKIDDRFRRPTHSYPPWYWVVKSIQERGVVATLNDTTHETIIEWNELNRCVKIS